MRNASGHQGENEEQWKKREQEHVRYFLNKTTAQIQKSVLCMHSCIFANYPRPINCFFFTNLVAFAASITRFYILFEQIINIIESFAFSSG